MLVYPILPSILLHCKLICLLALCLYSHGLFGVLLCTKLCCPDPTTTDAHSRYSTANTHTAYNTRTDPRSRYEQRTRAEQAKTSQQRRRHSSGTTFAFSLFGFPMFYSSSPSYTDDDDVTSGSSSFLSIISFIAMSMLISTAFNYMVTRRFNAARA